MRTLLLRWGYLTSEVPYGKNVSQATHRRSICGDIPFDGTFTSSFYVVMSGTRELNHTRCRNLNLVAADTMRTSTMFITPIHIGLHNSVIHCASQKGPRPSSSSSFRPILSSAPSPLISRRNCKKNRLGVSEIAVVLSRVTLIKGHTGRR